MLEVPILETSALSAFNVKEAFYLLLKEMYKVFINDKSSQGNKEDDISAQIGIDLNFGPKKKKCC